MAEHKSAKEQFAEQQAKQAISQRYVDPDSLDSARQDAVDRNRVPGEYSAGPIACSPPVGQPLEETDRLVTAIRNYPSGVILIAAAMGFVAALIVR